MKNLELIALSTALATALFVNGCSAGDEDENIPAASEKTVTVKNSDGSTFGQTCGTFVSSNGIEGMSLCQEGTSNIIGFIRTDATVTGGNGEVIGECAPDFDISQIGEVSGNCGLSTSTSTPDNSTTSIETINNHNNTNEGSTSTSTPNENEIDYGNTDIVDGEETTTQIPHPTNPQPTCSNQQPNLLPPCTGAPGEVSAN